MKENPSSTQRPTVRRRAHGRLAVLALGLVALVGLSGCTACEVQTVRGLYSAPEGIVAQVGSEYEDDWPYGLQLSTDGGQTWSWTSPEELGIPGFDEEPGSGLDGSAPVAEGESADAEADFVDNAPDPNANTDGEPQGGFGLDPDSSDTEELPRTGPQYEPVRASEGCLSNGRCFRTIPGEQVQEQINGRWETSFRFTDEELRRFEARDTACTDGSADALFGFLTVGGAVGGDDEASVAVVSMGNQGVLRLAGDGNQWERIAVGELSPISTFGPRWLSVLIFSPLVALAFTPLIFFINRSEATQRRRAVAFIIHLILTFALILFVGLLELVTLGDIDYAVMGLFSFICTVVVIGVSLAIVLPKGDDPALDPPPPAGPPSPVEPPVVRH